ncbi:MAG: 30S ribosomal protein S6 [Pirellulaceae bacterium]|nr:30S ribosomal protein S6 [Pirellulaceae bacterium]
MATKNYECMFVLDSNRYARDQTGVAKKLDEAIEELGGTVLASRLWNEQKLAFPINGHRKGSYWLMYFSMESTSLTDLNRQYQLNDNVMRHLIISVDERLIETLVAIAKGEAAPIKHEIESANSAVSSQRY